MSLLYPHQIYSNHLCGIEFVQPSPFFITHDHFPETKPHLSCVTSPHFVTYTNGSWRLAQLDSHPAAGSSLGWSQPVTKINQWWSSKIFHLTMTFLGQPSLTPLSSFFCQVSWNNSWCLSQVLFKPLYFQEKPKLYIFLTKFYRPFHKLLTPSLIPSRQIQIFTQVGNLRTVFEFCFLLHNRTK